MNKYCHYDLTEKVLMVDMSNLDLSLALAKEIFDELIATAKNLAETPYLLVCWHNTSMSAEVKVYYTERVTELRKYLKGIVRYGVTDFMTKIGLQVDSVERGKQSNIFNSKQEALAAIHNGQV